MTDEELDEEDRDVPALAVAALAAASRRARASGHPIVIVQDGKLVRITPEGTEVLEILPPPFKVSLQIKRAQH